MYQEWSYLSEGPPDLEARRVHWHSSGLTVLVTNNFVIGFEAYVLRENFMSWSKVYGWIGYKPQGRTCYC